MSSVVMVELHILSDNSITNNIWTVKTRPTSSHTHMIEGLGETHDMEWGTLTIKQWNCEVRTCCLVICAPVSNVLQYADILFKISCTQRIRQDKTGNMIQLIKPSSGLYQEH